MNRFDLSKIMFYTVLICTGIGLSFSFGLYSGAKRNAVFQFARDLKTTIENSLNTVSEEASTLAGTHPKHFLQPARYDGAGVTVNVPANAAEELILLSGFFEDANELRLVRRNGDLIARWPVQFYEIFPDASHMLHGTAPATDWNIDTHGALALPDGSVVFNFEGGGLVKLDRCGDVVWTLSRPTHHSVERAEGGGFWVPGTRFRGDGESPFPPFSTPLLEDTVLKVSDDGKVLTEFSVPEIFYDNGLEAVLTATGHSFLSAMNWDGEIVHLNKVEELSSDIAEDFPMFEVGDLALSIRELNMVMVIDPDTQEVKWSQIGPWLRQHDPEFKEGGMIVIFNNNIYRTAFIDFDITPLSVPRISNILEIDPISGEEEVVYGDKLDQEMLSVQRGKVEITPDLNYLITEFEGGRVFEVDPQGSIVWEYVNRYSADEVAEITEARVYPATYFTVDDWSCPRAAQ